MPARPLPESLASQMREKYNAGMSVADIARAFDRTYNYVYQTVVIRPRDVKVRQAAPSQAVAALTEGEAKKLSDVELYELVERKSQGRDQRKSRVVATDELDRRDPSGKWIEKSAKWAATHLKPSERETVG